MYRSYYVNAPGVGTEEGCVWGTISEPIGNWAAFVAGANTVADGSTYVKLGWNPEWQGAALSSVKPTYGLEIECPDGGCNGLPCKIDGDGVSGDSDFCVVTVPKGGVANINVYNMDGSVGDGDDGEDEDPTETPESTTAESTPEPTPTTTSTPTTSTTTTPPPTTTSSVEETTSSEVSTTTTSSEIRTTTSSSTYSPSSHKVKTTSTYQYGGIFQENATSIVTHSPTTSKPILTETTTTQPPAPTSTESNDNAGSHQRGGAIAGLIVAFIAAGILL